MKIVYTRSSTIYDDSRATKEINALLEAGYHVVVLGWDRTGNAKSLCNELFDIKKRSITFKFFDGKVGNNFISKLISRVKWGKWLKRALRYESEISVIHACDYDTGATIRRFAIKHKIKYVYDIFDYYVDAHSVPNPSLIILFAPCQFSPLIDGSSDALIHSNFTELLFLVTLKLTFAITLTE